MNEKLAKNLKAALTKNRDSKLKFALVLKGGSDGVLIVSKTIQNTDIEDAKKQSGGSAVIKGFCFGEEGKVIFEVGKQPASNWQAAAKKIAHKEAKVTINPEFRYSKDAESDETPPTPGVDGQAEYEKKLKELNPKIEQARHNVQLFPEIGDVLEQAMAEAEKGNFNNAMIGLARVEKVVGKALSTNADKPTSPAAKEWDQRLQTEAPDITMALLEEHKDKRLLQKAFDEAKKLAEAQSFERALPLLTAASATAKKILEDAGEPEEGGKLQKTYEEYLAGAKEAFAGLEKEHPEQAKKYEATLAKALGLGQAKKYKQGIIACENFVQLIDNCWKTIEFEAKVDLKNGKIGKAVGKGAYGEVFLLDGGDGKSSLVLKEGKLDDMEQEAKVYEELGAHPNIARCLGVQTVDGKTGMVMEAIKGGDVSKAMTNMRARLEKGEISQEDYWGAMQLSLQKTLEVLAFMESRGIAHMDIKPDNIMVDDETGELKVIDLGVSGKEGEAKGGTPGYMSPQALGGKGGVQDDVFSVGASAFEMGEGKRFAYGRESLGNQWAAMYAAMSYGQDDPNVQAVKNKGGKDYQSDFMNFVNALMHPDPKMRPSPSQALSAPFLKDRILSDDQAKEVLKGGKQKPTPKSDRAGIPVVVTAGFTANAFQKTLNDAFQAGAITDPGGTATMVAEALSKLPDLEGKFARLPILDQLADVGGHGKAGGTALDIVTKGVANLLKKPDYQGHPTIKDYLEGIAAEAENKRGAFQANRGQVAVTLTPGLTKAAFKKTLQDAATAGALPDNGGGTADAIADAIEELLRLEQKYAGLDPSTQWNDVEPTSVAGLAAIDAIANGITTLLQQSAFQGHPSLKRYLETTARSAELKRPNFAMKTVQVAAPTLIADHFHDAWTTAKNTATANFRTAVPLMLQKINTDSQTQPNAKAYIKEQLEKTGLNNAKSLDKFFDFSENLGGALDALEKALKKGAAAKERTKANEILLKYFKTVREKQKELPPGIGPDFCGPLATSLHNLVESIK